MLYEYECQECCEIFEQLVSTYNKATTTCPTCNNVAVRIISLSNFSLKGNGWFKDGYSKQEDV